VQTPHRPKLQPAVHAGDHSQGPDDAPITVVEYGDYQCPYCGQAHPGVRALQQRFGKRLRFVFRNFPLAEVHPEALHAAEAAESVDAHAGAAAFWEMHHALFVHQRDEEWALDDAHLGAYAASVGASEKQVLADVAGGAFEAKVRADFLSGVHSGVNGTPTFFINGMRFEENWTDVNEFAAALEAAG
jgi:protein-disulfide isomerase